MNVNDVIADPNRSRHRPTQLHPKGDWLGKRRLPEYQTKLRTKDGTTHQISVVGRVAYCNVHNNPALNALHLGVGGTGCAPILKAWNEKMQSYSELLDYRGRRLSTLDILQLCVGATVVNEVMELSKLNANEAAYVLDHFPEIGKDPAWLRDAPEGYSSLEWAYLKKYGDLELSKWLKRGGVGAMDLLDAIANHDRDLLDPFISNHMFLLIPWNLTVHTKNIIDAIEKGNYQLENVEVYEYWDSIHKNKPHHYGYSIIEKGAIPREEWTAADEPVVLGQHKLQLQNGRLKCLAHGVDHPWCRLWLTGDGARKEMGWAMLARLGERINVATLGAMSDDELLKLRSMRNLDLAAGYIGRTVKTGTFLDALAWGLEYSDLERWHDITDGRIEAVYAGRQLSRLFPGIPDTVVAKLARTVNWEQNSAKTLLKHHPEAIHKLFEYLDAGYNVSEMVTTIAGLAKDVDYDQAIQYPPVVPQPINLMRKASSRSTLDGAARQLAAPRGWEATFAISSPGIS